MTRGRNRQTLAWTLGLAGAAGCAITAGLTADLGLFSPEVLIYLTFITSGLLGALVASREPVNPVGWLMCAASLAAILLFLPLDYGYEAQVIQRGAWPLGGTALWFAGWGWAPALGLFLPSLTVRFPDGRVPSRWWPVDWLASAGTAVFALGVSLAPADMLVRFLLIPPSLAAVFARSIHNPLGALLPAPLLDLVIGAGFSLILLAYLGSVASIIDRFRHARGEERLQLKWFAYAGVVMAVALVYGGVVLIVGAIPPTVVEIALHLSLFALPLTIGIAIVRYHLYDIDLILNRTLVWVSLTGILSAIYEALITLMQLLFVSASGQKSDAAYVLTAFVVVAGFGPLRDWLQGVVDRRIVHRNPSALLDEFRSDVEAVVSVIDVHRVACRLLDQAVIAFGARGAALYLRSGEASPHYSRGSLAGEAGIEVPLRYEDRHLGRLVLGTRHGDVTYTEHDRAVLQRSADSVGEALALAEHLGFRPLPKSQPEVSRRSPAETGQTSRV